MRKTEGGNLSIEQIEDLRLAASLMVGEKRRAFQAQITIKYCEGSARKAERILGWNRKTVELGLAEKRSGIICQGAQSGRCGGKRWEERQPRVASELQQIAEAHGQQDPTNKSTIACHSFNSSPSLRGTKKTG